MSKSYSKGKHTPGPWELFETKQLSFPIQVMLPNGQTAIAKVCNENGLANAALIAMAPTLLEWCKSAVKFCPVDVQDSMLAAIRKAEGM